MPRTRTLSWTPRGSPLAILKTRGSSLGVAWRAVARRGRLGAGMCDSPVPAAAAVPAALLLKAPTAALPSGLAGGSGTYCRRAVGQSLSLSGDVDPPGPGSGTRKTAVCCSAACWGCAGGAL